MANGCQCWRKSELTGAGPGSACKSPNVRPADIPDAKPSKRRWKLSEILGMILNPRYSKAIRIQKRRKKQTIVAIGANGCSLLGVVRPIARDVRRTRRR